MSEWRDPSTYRDFDELMDRLDAIVSAVKSKDVTIEESLDLLEEGIELGIRATDLVEKPDFTRREQEALEQGDAATTDGAQDADEAPGSSEARAADAAESSEADDSMGAKGDSEVADAVEVAAVDGSAESSKA